MIHRYSSYSHYAAHTQPIWEALPESVRGGSFAPRSGCWWGAPPRSAMPHGLFLVAGLVDAQRLARRPLVYVEHGAGQTYGGDERSAGHGSYSGGAGLGSVVLFLCPSETVADRWRATYPATPALAVGSPFLDRYHAPLPGSGVERETPDPLRSGVSPRTVAVSFHFDCPLIPETRWALPHYQAALAPLRDAVRAAGGEMLGHGHPRAWSALRRSWVALGVPSTPDLADVLDQAAVLVADNTSALYEFASLGRPVVVLNAPWYRTNVHHGYRFWSEIPGEQVDEPADLIPAVMRALDDPGATASLRERATSAVYAQTDGLAAERAAAAIMEVL